MLVHAAPLRLILSQVPFEILVASAANAAMSAFAAIRYDFSPTTQPEQCGPDSRAHCHATVRRVPGLATVAEAEPEQADGARGKGTACRCLCTVAVRATAADARAPDAAMALAQRAYQLDDRHFSAYPLDIGEVHLAMQQPAEALPWLRLAYERAKQPITPPAFVEHLPPQMQRSMRLSTSGPTDTGSNEWQGP